MTRARLERPGPAALSALAERGRIAVRVTPGARTEGLELADGKLQIKVRAKPDGGKANEAALTLLARALEVPRSRLKLLRGATSREKLIQLGD